MSRSPFTQYFFVSSFSRRILTPISAVVKEISFHSNVYQYNALQLFQSFGFRLATDQWLKGKRGIDNINSVLSPLFVCLFVRF